MDTHTRAVSQCRIETMTKGKILLVDDDKVMRNTVAVILRDSGYEVDEASNALWAYQHLKYAPRLPHVILLDLMMPVMCGDELVDAMAKDERLAALPVILISGHVEQSSKLQGVERTFRKPVPVDELLKAVDTYCGRAQS